MASSKKQTLKFILCIALGLAASFFLCFAFYCSFVISSLPLNSIEQKAPQFLEAKKEGDHIDEGTQVRRSDFEVYWTWNQSDIGTTMEISQEQKIKRLGASGKSLNFFETKVLPPPQSNDCRDKYCLQHRLMFHEIPSLLWKGLIGIEDYRFLDHKGVDPRSLLRALWHDLKVLRLEQGGSTLTQQLVKNLFYTNEKTFSRKFKEMIVSAYLEFKLNKEEILRMYFNEVLWGSFQGIKLKGVWAASLGYFNKKPRELTAFEASILIALLKGPYYYSPQNHFERLKERVLVVFNKLKELNLFSQNVSPWSKAQWKRWKKKIELRKKGVLLRSLYALTKAQGPKNFKTFILIKEIEKLRKDLHQKYPQKDLAIKTLLFNVSKETVERTFQYYTKLERNWDRAFREERHQVGSTLKPILYWLLVQRGLLLSDEVETKAFTLHLKSGPWSPREAHREKEEKVTYRKALIHSLNRPIIRAVQKSGFDEMENELKILIPQLLTPLREYPSQLLGSLEMSLSEMGELYAMFLQESCHKGRGGDVLEALSDPRETTIRFRVGENLGKMSFFGKTGTTNNGNDSWFIGYDGKELLLTWVGLESQRNQGEKLQLYGSNTAFLVFRNYFLNRGRLFNEMACLKNEE